MSSSLPPGNNRSPKRRRQNTHRSINNGNDNDDHRKIGKRRAIPSSLEKLVSKFETLMNDPTKQVQTVSVDEAAIMVRSIMGVADDNVINDDATTSVTYDKSLYLWWDWYSKSKDICEKTKKRKDGCDDDDDATENNHPDYEQVLRNAVMETTDNVAQLVSSLPTNQALQVVKLEGAISASSLPHPELVEKLQELLPSDYETTPFIPKEERIKAARLAKELYPYVEHDDGKLGVYGFIWISSSTADSDEDSSGGKSYCEETGTGLKGLSKLFYRLWECASLNIRAVTLSLRVSPNTPLDEIGQTLDRFYQVSKRICPIDAAHKNSDGDMPSSKTPALWCIGPPSGQPSVDDNGNDDDEEDGGESTTTSRRPTSTIRSLRLPHGHDQRYYLIIGTPGGLTKSHWDRGIQTVLYHTVAGCNHVVTVPREVAAMLQAVDNGGGYDDHNQLENDVLQRLSDHDEKRHLALTPASPAATIEGSRNGQLIKAGTFHAGETMLILPGGGHAVLTGSSGKVILANEWHWQSK